MEGRQEKVLYPPEHVPEKTAGSQLRSHCSHCDLPCRISQSGGFVYHLSLAGNWFIFCNMEHLVHCWVKCGGMLHKAVLWLSLFESDSKCLAAAKSHRYAPSVEETATFMGCGIYLDVSKGDLHLSGFCLFWFDFLIMFNSNSMVQCHSWIWSNIRRVIFFRRCTF